jgi:hypothetical protein
VAELLGAAAVGVPRPVDRVTVAQEDVDGEPFSGRRTHVGAERAVGRGVPRHLVPDPPLVLERLVDRALGDDDEPGVPVVQELQPGVLRGEPGAARALPLLAVEPHVVVDDQLRLAVEDVRQPDRPVLALEGVVGQLHHRQPAALGGDRVELAGGGLLSYTQFVQLLLPGVGVDDRR